MTPVGVLVMAYGGPDSLEDVEPYLLDVRGGRPTPPALVEEIKARYAQIGGKSPLLEITNRQASALEAELNRRSQGSPTYRAYVGMRHWTPRIREAVEEMSSAGIRSAVALVMAPHYSRMSTEVYLQRLEEALVETGAEIEFAPIRSWHREPGLIAAVAKNARLALEQFDSPPYVLFTAHSLPARIVEQGDPYPEQLLETAALVAGELWLPQGRWSFAYQSAGRTPEPWLGPKIEEEIPRLANSGEKNILVVPAGFTADHVEVLYDVDIEARRQAESLGMRLERSASLNASPELISALASRVEAETSKLPS